MCDMCSRSGDSRSVSSFLEEGLRGECGARVTKWSECYETQIQFSNEMGQRIGTKNWDKELGQRNGTTFW